MLEQHSILAGKVHVYKRPNSSLWQCSTYFAGKNRRISTTEESPRERLRHLLFLVNHGARQDPPI